MEMVGVRSRAVIAIGYEDGRIRVTFHTGRTYEYYGSEADFNFILNSRSIGAAVKTLGDGVEV